MKGLARIGAHLFIIIIIVFLFLPLYLALITASYTSSITMHGPVPFTFGSAFFKNITKVLSYEFAIINDKPLILMLFNSFVSAFIIAMGKIILALGTAFSLVYFDFYGKKICFVLIFATMMLPIEVRIIPTFQVAVTYGLLNSFAGLTLPLLASATGTFLFRQFFKTISPQLVEAAKMDGAGPMRFFIDILLPISKTQIAALFVILFVYGWNQYLWPLIITIDAKMATIVMGVSYLANASEQIPQWNYIMAISIIALIVPCLIVILMQRWFEKGFN